MSDESHLLTTKELIKAATDHKSLKAAKQEYIPDSIEEAKRKREETRKKWADWNKNRPKTDKDE